MGLSIQSLLLKNTFFYFLPTQSKDFKFGVKVRSFVVVIYVTRVLAILVFRIQLLDTLVFVCQ